MFADDALQFFFIASFHGMVHLPMFLLGGTNTMGKDIVIRAKLLQGATPMDYAGVPSSAVADPNNC